MEVDLYLVVSITSFFRKVIYVSCDWLCFSPILKIPYCQTFFADRQNHNLKWAWINGVPGNSKNYGLKIKRHEVSAVHVESTAIYQRWKMGHKLDQDAEQELNNQAYLWRNVCIRTQVS